MLTHIINTSLHTGTFPTAFKQARVSPLLKKNSLNLALLENYTPVSLLPFIAKTLEQIVFNQLSLFLAQNNLLDIKQSGFKSGHSTETTLLSYSYSCGSSLTSQMGPSGCLGGVRFLSHNFLHCYAYDTQLFSFQPNDLMVAARIAACLSDMFSWMKDHRFSSTLLRQKLGLSTITPSRTARNLKDVIDDQSSLTDHIATMTQSCRYNISLQD